MRTLFLLLVLLATGATTATAADPSSLFVLTDTGTSTRLLALTDKAGVTTLSLYDQGRTLHKSVALRSPARTLCAGPTYIVVAHRKGGLSLFSRDLLFKKRVSSVPILALACGADHFYTGGRTIRVRKWSIATMKPVATIGEHASFVNGLYIHPGGGLISVSWDHEAVWFKPGAPKKRFVLHSTPIHSAVSTSHQILAILSDADKIRFFTLTGKKLNWAREPGARCVATEGNVLLVGLARGAADRYVFKGSRFVKKGRIQLLDNAPVDALAPLGGGWWAIRSGGALHFKKP